METEELNSISVITVTKNAGNQIKNLISSLEEQSDKNFTWIIQDCCSDDDTTLLVSSSSLNQISIVSESDFSIYDALNRALSRCQTEYYLVLGADDVITRDAIAAYRDAASEHATDFIAASVIVGGLKRPPGANMGWLRGLPGIASSHSVGLLIRRELHDRLGFYTHKYPIVADQYFVKNALSSGATISRKSFISGSYALGGYSGRDKVRYLMDFSAMQWETESNKLLQILLFILRAAKLATSSSITAVFMKQEKK